jgi:hypothetical protein
LSLGNEHLYVSSGTSVYSLPLAGGEPRHLASLDGDYLRTIVADKNGVYVVVTVFGEGDGVFRYVAQNGDQIDLAEGQGSVGSVVMDATRIYWSGSISGQPAYIRARCRL